jgi:hypothetical protein
MNQKHIFVNLFFIFILIGLFFGIFGFTLRIFPHYINEFDSDVRFSDEIYLDSTSEYEISLSYDWFDELHSDGYIEFIVNSGSKLNISYEITSGYLFTEEKFYLNDKEIQSFSVPDSRTYIIEINHNGGYTKVSLLEYGFNGLHFIYFLFLGLSFFLIGFISLILYSIKALKAFSPSILLDLNLFKLRPSLIIFFVIWVIQVMITSFYYFTDPSFNSSIDQIMNIFVLYLIIGIIFSPVIVFTFVLFGILILKSFKMINNSHKTEIKAISTITITNMLFIMYLIGNFGIGLKLLPKYKPLEAIFENLFSIAIIPSISGFIWIFSLTTFPFLLLVYITNILIEKYGYSESF